MFELRFDLWLTSLSVGPGQGETHQFAEKRLLGGAGRGWEGLGLVEGTGQADQQLPGPGGHPSHRVTAVTSGHPRRPPQPQSHSQGSTPELT